MSRNQNSMFSLLPSVNIKRSRFNRPQSIKFTGNTGVLIPFYVDEVLPGDTHQIKTNKVVRLQTPITPFMDQMYLDTYYFFVPNRLVWNNWKEFNGENSNSPWVSNITYEVPQLEIKTSVSGGVSPGSAADYMGIPVGKHGISVNALPFRAYALIWNEWFRDQNLQYPQQVDKSGVTQDLYTGTTVITGSSAGTALTRGAIGAVSKFHDYFTSALPYPQKGPDVTINMIANPVQVEANGVLKVSGGSGTSAFTAGLGTTLGVSDPTNVKLESVSPSGTSTGNAHLSYDSGLQVDLTGLSVATISQLRTAFSIQKLYEADARGGSRYTELLRQHFGVISPDARLQRPEYLGGNRIPINVHQVVQSSETGSTPQGTTAAYSLTVDAHGEFIRSFTEHGFIIGVCCVRYDHTYQQGIEKFWSRKTRFDYFWPVFAHLSEQAIKNKEVFAQGSDVVDSNGDPYDEQVFGYQEAWADYRYKPSRIAGEMRSGLSNSLDFWHLADNYASLPALSSGWIVEDKSNVDRVLQVTSAVSNQLLFDIYVENNTTRPMPVHSIPGLVDHF